MNFLTHTRRLAAALLLTGLCGGAWAQPYPNKPIEVMVAFQPGGGTDSLARACRPSATWRGNWA